MGETANIGGVETHTLDSSYPRSSNPKVAETMKADGRGTTFNSGDVYDQGGGISSGNLVDGERKQVLNLPGQTVVKHIFKPYLDNFREECPVPPAGTQDVDPP